MYYTRLHTELQAAVCHCPQVVEALHTLHNTCTLTLQPESFYPCQLWLVPEVVLFRSGQRVLFEQLEEYNRTESALWGFAHRYGVFHTQAGQFTARHRPCIHDYAHKRCITSPKQDARIEIDSLHSVKHVG